MPTLGDVAASFREQTEKEMTELIKKILRATQFSAKIDLLGNAIVDGTTEQWESYLRFALALEEIEGAK